MPHRLLPRKMTSPTARVLASIWIAVFGVSGYTLFINYRETSCDEEFRQAILDRANVNKETDYWENEQRKAIADWVNDFATPPPWAAEYGPGRMIWLQGVSQRAIVRFTTMDNARQEALKRRPGLPDLRCGR
jgi:hypothetical protein